MKKKQISLLIALEVLLIIVVVGYNVFHIGQPKDTAYIIEKELKPNESVSLNYLLKYEMPEGYKQAQDIQGELSIINEETQTIFSAQDVLKKELSIEDFFALQNYEEQGLNATLVSENTEELEDKVINKKVYQISNDFINLYSFIGSIELKSNPEEFIGVLGNSQSLDAEKDFNMLLNSINYTSQTLADEKTFDDINENIVITTPPMWRRLGDGYSFIKSTEDVKEYLLINSGNKNDEDIKAGYDMIKDSILQDNYFKLITDSNVTNLKNKTITTSVFQGEDKKFTTFIVMVEFNNSDIFAVFRYDLFGEYNLSQENLDLKFFVENIKLK